MVPSSLVLKGEGGGAGRNVCNLRSEVRQISSTSKGSLACADAVFYLQALSVGIFPYVLKLLQSSARELRPLLVFIWAKILAVDSVSNFHLAPVVGSRALPVDLELPHLRDPRSSGGSHSYSSVLHAFSL